MGCRREPPLRRAAAAQEDDRLVALTRQFEKAAPVLDVFEVAADRPRERIGQVEFEEIGGGDVRAVSRRDRPAESQPLHLPPLDHVGGQAAALGDEADRADLARCIVGKGETAARGIGAEAIGADDAYAAAVRLLDEVAFEVAAALDLGKAARYHLGEPQMAVRRGKKWPDALGADGDECVVDRPRRRGDALVGRQPLDLGGFGMNGIEFAGEPERLHSPDKGVGKRDASLRRSPEHADGPGLEQRTEALQRRQIVVRLLAGGGRERLAISQDHAGIDCDQPALADDDRVDVELGDIRLQAASAARRGRRPS